MPDDTQRVRVGVELRRLREEAQLSGQEVAAAVGWSQSKLSRIETARFGFTIAELTVLLDYYGVPEEVRAELLGATAEEGGVNGAWVVRAGGPVRRQGEVAAVESRVTRMRQYHPIIMPGQLQSRNYAKNLAAAAGFKDPNEIANRRLRRQTLLGNTGSPDYTAVVDARSLCRWPGPRRVIVDQLEHLLARAALPTVSIRLLRMGGGIAVMALTPFVIYDFRAGTSPTVVLLEAQNTDLYLSADQDVEIYASLFDRLTEEAMTESDSLDTLRSLVDHMRADKKATPGGVLA